MVERATHVVRLHYRGYNFIGGYNFEMCSIYKKKKSKYKSGGGGVNEEGHNKKQKVPKPRVTKQIESGIFQFLDLDPIEVSRQITLIDFSVFQSIRPQGILLKKKIHFKYISPL